MIKVPLSVPRLIHLREKFIELSRADPHLGLNPNVASLDEPSITLAAERYNLGQRVLMTNHAPLSQEFLKRGSPNSLRGKLWTQVLGSEITPKDVRAFDELKVSRRS